MMRSFFGKRAVLQVTENSYLPSIKLWDFQLRRYLCQVKQI